LRMDLAGGREQAKRKAACRKQRHLHGAANRSLI
jgi:hypothetical protein